MSTESAERHVRAGFSGHANRGLHPVGIWSLAMRLHDDGHRRRPAALKALCFLLFHAILPPEVRVGRNLQMNHRGMNVVVHPNTVIGDEARIQHGVTIASRSGLWEKKMTFVGDGVAIGAGAIILGPLSIGDQATIGAGAVVTRDVPAGEVWAGNPARRIRSNG